MGISPMTAGRGFEMLQVRIVEVMQYSCAVMETTTRRQFEVGLLPLRVRKPVLDEVWVVDRRYGQWSFAAITATARVGPSQTVSALPPVAPVLDDVWFDKSAVPVVVRIWNGTAWIG